MTRAALALAAGLLLGGAAGDGDTVERLTGVWSFERVEVEGVLQPVAPFATNKMVIARDGRYTILQGTRVTHGVLKLDPTKSPAHYDPQVTDGPSAGQGFPGIYEITGDRFRACLSLRAERPTEFVSTPGSGRLLFVFKREAAEIGPTLEEIGRVERSAGAAERQR